MILSLEMVFGGLGGFLFLGETLTWRESIGVVLMTIGVFLSQIPSRPLWKGCKKRDCD
jgi:drug/metabolite transporter (DMT)-like permease